MSQKEVGRLEIIQAVIGKRIRQGDAGRQLGLSTRQVKRLVRRYRQNGAAGLVSGHRGKRANNAIAAGVREEVLGLVHRQYADFTPTFAHEKLTEVHGYHFSVETLRQWRQSRTVCGGPSNASRLVFINAGYVVPALES
jgi:hypothetical protein